MHLIISHARRGYKFDSGGLRVRGTHEVVPTMTEQDVFRALKLKYMRESLLGLSRSKLQLMQQMLAQLQSSEMRIRRAQKMRRIARDICCCQSLQVFCSTILTLPKAGVLQEVL